MISWVCWESRVSIMMSNSAPLAGTSRARRLWATSMMLAPIWPITAETLHEQLARLPQQLEALTVAMAPGTVIWLGGLAPDALPQDSIPEGCVMLRSYAELEQRLDMLAT